MVIKIITAFQVIVFVVVFGFPRFSTALYLPPYGDCSTFSEAGQKRLIDCIESVYPDSSPLTSHRMKTLFNDYFKDTLNVTTVNDTDKMIITELVLCTTMAAYKTYPELAVVNWDCGLVDDQEDCMDSKMKSICPYEHVTTKTSTWSATNAVIQQNKRFF